MVDAVTGRAALALLSANSAAGHTGNRKNPLLPTPLNTSQQGSGQRASPILRFDTPKISGDIFSTLQNAALLSSSRSVVVGEERSRLELELRQRIEVIDTPGSPGSPGTPDRTETFTTTTSRLDAEALTSLGRLIDRLDRGSSGDRRDARLVESLQGALDRFGQTIGDSSAGTKLGEIIGRLENSVIGRDGLSFGDIFRDPGLFGSLGRALSDFAGDVGYRAAEALENVILKVGSRGFENPDANDPAVRAVAGAIDELGAALKGKSRASDAIGDVLERLQDRNTGNGYAYGQFANNLTDILRDTLTTLRGGDLDASAIAELRSALQSVQDLQGVPGRNDDKRRAEAVAGLNDILGRYASQTTSTSTVTTPGIPATPGTPGERTVNVIEETTAVPKVEFVQRVITIYESVQASVEPLRKLSQPPPAVPNLQALVVSPLQEDDEEGGGFVIRARTGDDEDQRFGIAARDGDNEDERGSRFGVIAAQADAGRPSAFGSGTFSPSSTGSLVDSRI